MSGESNAATPATLPATPAPSTPPPPPPPPKSKILAGLLGLVAPGLGQIFVGHTLRGLAWAIIPFAVIVSFLVFSHEPSPWTLLKVVAACAFVSYIGAIVDVALLPQHKHRPTSIPAVVIFGLVSFIAAPILSVMLRVLVVEAFKVPSGAMIPTIVVGDHLFADKLVYLKRAPRRGEVVIFKYPEHPSADFVKRAIAIPGDKLEVRKGHPVINGWEVPSCFVGPYKYSDPSDPEMGSHEGDLFVEFLDSTAYLVFFDTKSLEVDYQGPFFAKPDETWVLGDNRNNSHDSRMWFGGTGGGVPRSLVKGRARVIWLSPDSSRHGRDLAHDPIAPSPDLVAPLAKCMTGRPTLAQSTPPASSPQ